MKDKRTGFFKGLPGFTRESSELLYRDIEHGIYRWWWEFMRLSPVFWFALQTGAKPVVPKVAEVLEQAGDIRNDRFNRWWRDRGHHLFEEARRPLKLRRVDEQNFTDHIFYPEGKSMLVEVPLTITTRTLFKDFKKLLAVTHGDQRVDVLAHSSALWKLHTKRYNLMAIENEFWVLVYRLLYPDIAAWRIGDRLQIAPGLNLRGVEASRYLQKSTPISRMQSTVGRYLYQAQRRVTNAELGSFPNSKLTKSLEMPFGKSLHDKYIAATTDSLTESSAWRQWLYDEFHSTLVKRIKEKNRVTGSAAIDHKIIQRLPKFISGESDLL
jgi:hypothetical protein